MKMLSLLLSAEGFKEQEKVRLIHGLKKDLNAPDNPRHHYFISIFGEPSVESTWGWRFEGHHLSINCTLGEGKHFSVTPSFWGASPFGSPKEITKGLRSSQGSSPSACLWSNPSRPNKRRRRSSRTAKGRGPPQAYHAQPTNPKPALPIPVSTRASKGS